ncbi:MAG: DUF4345 domain-containing protein [Planctomycetota bacterium]
MQFTKTRRILLALAGLCAAYIGLSILLAPAAFHASNGIELALDPNLLSEVRAPGAALMTLGLLILLGAFVRALTLTSTVIAAAVYLSYGLGRLVSFGFDGLPGSGLIGATVIELVLGLACACALLSAKPRVAEPTACVTGRS